jgi:hypothetical protein
VVPSRSRSAGSRSVVSISGGAVWTGPSGDARSARPTSRGSSSAGEPVEDVALVRAARVDQLDDPRRVGEHPGDRVTRLRLGCGRQPERAEHRHEPQVGHASQQLGGGAAERAGVGAERFAHRRCQAQRIRVTPDQPERDQLAQCVGDRVRIHLTEQGNDTCERGGGLAPGGPCGSGPDGQGHRLQHAQQERVQSVDGSLHRRANTQPAGQGG